MENKLLEKEEMVNENAEAGIEDITSEVEAAASEATVEAANEAVEETQEVEAEANDETVEEIAEEPAIEEIKVAPVTEEKPLRADEFIHSEEEKGEGFLAFFKTVKWKRTWDKITTALLILLMASPLAILAYILLWFLTK